MTLSGQECSWLFQAPERHIVEMQFVGEFEMYCKVRHSLCMDYVEVRNSTDFANTGMRWVDRQRQPSPCTDTAATGLLTRLYAQPPRIWSCCSGHSIEAAGGSRRGRGPCPWQVSDPSTNRACPLKAIGSPGPLGQHVQRAVEPADPA